ncbi:hypothetical protein DICPUDRAFT_76443 [Dictyostelium purpureum]|uniref:THH1/TOM1/TOM3 domain-containing protein n=1 Tax=Dictyostelium purpureum TaxID=5786 RepID=F0ZDL9_DICPU|nr:uncharacterized protein DICPUDRAFT_76443 [Dictyostelium purpureum]EGC37963.1 hypothetical protein DICPUDRAFT_76443 [Dictyostelium purpureum]|eukprot:XP_003285534.1 hypothetical protein DICPUDRAFT_76443 [Dictyostelium purpureum]
MKWKYYDYDITHLVVSFLYFILSIFCTYSFIKRPKKQQNTQQLIFYPLLFLGVIIRAVFMFLQPFVREGEIVIPNQANILLNTLPSFTFFSTYLIVLFIWVEIYLISYGSSMRSIKALPIIFNVLTVVMYTALIILYVLDFTLYPIQHNPVSEFSTLPEMIIGYYDVGCFISASVLFFFFGLSLVIKFRHSQKNFAEDKRKTILRRITLLTGLICFCFLLRAAITLFALVDLNLISSYWWWFDGAYYCGLEIVPLWIMLYLLQMDRNKTRVASSAEYNEKTSLINPT